MNPKYTARSRHAALALAPEPVAYVSPGERLAAAWGDASLGERTEFITMVRSLLTLANNDMMLPALSNEEAMAVEELRSAVFSIGSRGVRTPKPRTVP